MVEAGTEEGELAVREVAPVAGWRVAGWPGTEEEGSLVAEEEVQDWPVAAVAEGGP